MSEFLPSQVYALLRQTKAKAAETHYKFVWVWRGRVCLRRDSGQPIIHIDTIYDLSKLICLPVTETITTAPAIPSTLRARVEAKSPGSSLKIAQFNANSLLGHIDIVRKYFESNFFHIISVCETWLHSLIRDDLVMLNDFFMIRNDREGKRGGGVAVYIHKSLKVKWLAASSGLFTNSPKFLMLEIRSPNNDALLFMSLYRRTKGTLFDDFLEAYNSFSHVYENIIIAGDVNCGLHAVHYESSYSKDLVYSSSLHLIDSAATYHTATSDSWLDIIVTASE